MRYTICSLLVALMPLAGWAAEQIGPIYPIAEPDMLQELQETLARKQQSGELARLQKQAIEKSRQSIETPKPNNTLVRTASPRTFYFDPSYVAPQTITGPNGEVIVRAGDRVNPLDYTGLTKRLVFFDGRDPQQVEMVARMLNASPIRSKPIMTAGAVFEVTRRWKQQVFFDQGGALVRRFAITQVPAVVYQEGKRLRIDEVLVQ